MYWVMPHSIVHDNLFLYCIKNLTFFIRACYTNWGGANSNFQLKYYLIETMVFIFHTVIYIYINSTVLHFKIHWISSKQIWNRSFVTHISFHLMIIFGWKTKIKCIYALESVWFTRMINFQHLNLWKMEFWKQLTYIF